LFFGDGFKPFLVLVVGFVWFCWFFYVYF